jgi:glucose/mannose-6-phosphate isomerase
VIAISYSGNTEETLHALRELSQKQCQIRIITSGGKLLEYAQANKWETCIIPTDIQPRMALGYLTVPLLELLIPQTYDWDKIAIELRLMEENTKEKAQMIAQSIKGIPVIYASEQNFICAYKWKINFNENAKIPAFCNFFPEWNHNEINGYKSSHPFTPMFIEEKEDHPQITKRFHILQKILKEQGYHPIMIKGTGTSRLTRILSSIWVGDWVSYYTALSKNEEPEPVKMIEELKQLLR